MSNKSHAPTSEQEQDQSVEVEEYEEYDQDLQQCALDEGCDEEVPTLDEIFGTGFVDEEQMILADMTEVTAESMTMQSKLPSEEHISLLEHHIEGAFGLEEAMSKAIVEAQAGATFVEGEVDADWEVVGDAREFLNRIEVSLDLMREHNKLYGAVMAADLATKFQGLAEFGAALIEGTMVREMEKDTAHCEALLKKMDASWKVAATSLAQVPANVAVNAATGAAITAGVPLILGALGVSGTLPALLAAAAIAKGISFAADAVKGSWGTDVNGLHDGLSGLNGHLNFASDVASVKEVGEKINGSAETMGKVTLAVGVLFDAVEAGVAIDGFYQAKADWDAYVVAEDARQAKWTGLRDLMMNCTTQAARLQGQVMDLSDMVVECEAEIMQLEGLYGAELYV